MSEGIKRDRERELIKVLNFYRTPIKFDVLSTIARKGKPRTIPRFMLFYRWYGEPTDKLRDMVVKWMRDPGHVQLTVTKGYQVKPKEETP